jgi:hypothetical protein
LFFTAIANKNGIVKNTICCYISADDDEYDDLFDNIDDYKEQEGEGGLRI